ncbi:SDR family NAD(P)-dependent oxidoreductase [Nonomuraea sp. KC401]|uniref:SDR family oxidoreductase n=1 Tax=unclassified Nonomuraea TaxID=2593643 RepID=UPI0010FD9C5E|nr:MULTISPECIES: SDR family NAD(P)-dependent oxidoreductase [unclassified Nonomuraea]NBE99281.1 SDR family NAD(P)-dependent oxidoreductase [Nonomuraea sp. K271]TLF50535.1 SDR family NAD(P)-dependent oxidoreductase [Nonomuraea sp. KC401]
MNITHAVVTGAGGGIGKALAAGLRAEGAHVVLADIDAAGLAAASAEIGADAVPTDVADPAAMEALADAAPGADLVCLNAGIVGGDVGVPWEVADDDWDRVFAVNVGGVRNGLRAFVPRMLASGRPGHILITASLAGLVTFPGGGAYPASKHAVVALAEQTALALDGTPVGVTLLCPGAVRTAMMHQGEEPAAVADAALAAVRDGRFTVTPAEWRAAVTRRAERLASGAHPGIPSPS